MVYVPQEFYLALQYHDRFNTKRWHYYTTDDEVTVEAAGYFSDFLLRGGGVGDKIVVFRYATALPANASPPLGTASSAAGAPAPSVIAEYVANAVTAAGAAGLSINVNVVT